MHPLRISCFILAAIAPHFAHASFDAEQGRLHLTIAYTIFWVLAFVVIFFLGKKQLQNKKEIEALKQRISRLEQQQQSDSNSPQH